MGNSAQAQTSGIRSFDTFVEDECCGKISFSLDEEFDDRTTRIFGAARTDGSVHMSIVPLLLMRAFTTIVDNRPPGNLHVGQTCELHQLPRAGSTLDAEVFCRYKEIKRNRLIIRFEVFLSEPSTGHRLLSGLTTIFWAK